MLYLISHCVSRDLHESEMLPQQMAKLLVQVVMEVQEERRVTHASLNAARDVQFDSQVMLRQLQANLKHVDQMKEIYSSQQSEENVAKWCKNFQKQQLANIELKEKLNYLSKENDELKESFTGNERQIQDLLSNFIEVSENVSVNSRTYDSVNHDPDVATIAIQTTGVATQEEDSNIARYIADNNEVLGQAISDLDKQRALNANLQRNLREKELSLISKDQLINKVKTEMNMYKTSPKIVPPSTPEHVQLLTPISTRFDNFSDQDTSETSTSRRLEDNNQIVLRYQALIQKANEDHQTEINKTKHELTQVIKERDAALRQIKDLQFFLDSIPNRDGDSGLNPQQFVDQIQAMTETVRLLEKQLSATRIEMTDLQAKLSLSETKLKDDTAKHTYERERQEIACRKKAQLKEEECKRFSREIENLKLEIETLRQQCSKFQKQASESPTILLTALVEKMREKLIENDKVIKQLQNRK